MLAVLLGQRLDQGLTNKSAPGDASSFDRCCADGVAEQRTTGLRQYDPRNCENYDSPD